MDGAADVPFSLRGHSGQEPVRQFAPADAIAMVVLSNPEMA
jgi:hypothetical protein